MDTPPLPPFLFLLHLRANLCSKLGKESLPFISNLKALNYNYTIQFAHFRSAAEARGWKEDVDACRRSYEHVKHEKAVGFHNRPIILEENSGNESADSNDESEDSDDNESADSDDESEDSYEIESADSDDESEDSDNNESTDADDESESDDWSEDSDDKRNPRRMVRVLRAMKYGSCGFIGFLGLLFELFGSLCY